MHDVIYVIENELGRQFNQQCASQATKTQTWIYCVSSGEIMLKCETNRRKLDQLTWNIVIYQDNHSGRYGYAVIPTLLCVDSACEIQFNIQT